MEHRHIRPDVTITPGAFARINEIMTDEPPGTALRIAVAGGGCSGFRYTFDLTGDCDTNDFELSQGNAKILIDPISLELLKGATIDFVDDLIGRSFKINNPNATTSCGCGTSFSI